MAKNKLDLDRLIDEELTYFEWLKCYDQDSISQEVEIKLIEMIHDIIEHDENNFVLFNKQYTPEGFPFYVATKINYRTFKKTKLYKVLSTFKVKLKGEV